VNLGYDKKTFTKISDVKIPEIFYNRFKTGIDALDEIFGGGLLPGSTITLKARPGVGKSVFALSLAELLTKAGYTVGYTSGEESQEQLAFNCARLKVEDLQVATITDVTEILEHLPDMDFMVIDSFQTLTANLDLSNKQKTEYFINNLVRKAKDNHCTLLFIVQETSSGEIRGGPTLLYAVDVNMEILKCKLDKDVRIISNYKNRCGPIGDHGAKFGKDGYEFIGLYDGEPEQEKTKKVPVKDSRKEEILLMDDPPLITVNRVMDHFEIKEQTARLLLSELENEMKVIKYGRGQSAIWKRFTPKVNT
jgi:predicted ATP-dependent serine protease